MKLLRVEAPWFVAGAEFAKDGEQWACTRAAPIIKWFVGSDVTKIKVYLDKIKARYGWYEY